MSVKLLTRQTDDAAVMMIDRHAIVIEPDLAAAPHNLQAPLAAQGSDEAAAHCGKGPRPRN